MQTATLDEPLTPSPKVPQRFTGKGFQNTDHGMEHNAMRLHNSRQADQTGVILHQKTSAVRLRFTKHNLSMLILRNYKKQGCLQLQTALFDELLTPSPKVHYLTVISLFVPVNPPPSSAISSTFLLSGSVTVTLKAFAAFFAL